MTDMDDKQIRHFFETEKREIEDNGFSRRVMRRLPNHIHRGTQLWNLFVVLVGVILFVIFDGLTAVVNTLHEVFISMMQSGASQVDLRSLMIAAVVLLILGIRKVWTTD